MLHTFFLAVKAAFLFIFIYFCSFLVASGSEGRFSAKPALSSDPPPQQQLCMRQQVILCLATFAPQWLCVCVRVPGLCVPFSPEAICQCVCAHLCVFLYLLHVESQNRFLLAKRGHFLTREDILAAPPNSI